MDSQRPSVFIGSSGKSLKVAKALSAGLKRIADVTLWSEHPGFRKPGRLFLPVLLEQPERFDFAVMVFGPDDRVVTDKGMFGVPRDNVVFELGLFMGQLGMRRAFVVAPAGKDQVKILSDVAGLIWTNYKPPNDVKEAVVKISGEIEENYRRNVLAYDGPSSVYKFEETLLGEVKRRWNNKEHVTVCNFALDMEATWGPMHAHLNRRETHELTWRSVMLDPEWPIFREIESDSVSLKRANINIELIQEFCSRHQREMVERRISFECRTYRDLPLIHGFLVNDSFLIFTLLRRAKDGRVIALDNAYIRFPRKNEISMHTIQAYSGWFNYAWENSNRWIWPPKS